METTAEAVLVPAKACGAAASLLVSLLSSVLVQTIQSACVVMALWWLALGRAVVHVARGAHVSSLDCT